MRRLTPAGRLAASAHAPRTGRIPAQTAPRGISVAPIGRLLRSPIRCYKIVSRTGRSPDVDFSRQVESQCAPSRDRLVFRDLLHRQSENQQCSLAELLVASFVNLKCSNAALAEKERRLVRSAPHSSLLTRQLLFDDDTKRFDASLIVAGGRLEVLGPDSQHRGLKLNERQGRIDPDRGGGSADTGAARGTSTRDSCKRQKRAM